MRLKEKKEIGNGEGWKEKEGRDRRVEFVSWKKRRLDDRIRGNKACREVAFKCKRRKVNRIWRLYVGESLANDGRSSNEMRQLETIFDKLYVVRRVKENEDGGRERSADREKGRQGALLAEAVRRKRDDSVLDSVVFPYLRRCFFFRIFTNATNPRVSGMCVPTECDLILALLSTYTYVYLHVHAHVIVSVHVSGGPRFAYRQLVRIHLH